MQKNRSTPTCRHTGSLTRMHAYCHYHHQYKRTKNHWSLISLNINGLNSPIKRHKLPNAMSHTCNPSTLGYRGRCIAVSLKPAWPTQWVQTATAVQKDPVSKNHNENQTNKIKQKTQANIMNVLTESIILLHTSN